jgi:F-type H+-transporting ATPase subunit b
MWLTRRLRLQRCATEETVMTRILTPLLLVVLASPAFAAAEGEHGAHVKATYLGLDATGWVALAMIAFIGVLLYFGAHKTVANGLDGQIAKIKEQLDEAAKLRTEAEKLRADYDAKRAEADRLAADIVEQAKREAAELIANAQTQVATMTQRRTEAAEARIAAAERAAVADVRAQASGLGLAAARQLLGAKLDGAAKDRLVDQAIAELDRKLH